MSRPRKPYGPNPPGRLAATMIKVLAAEMSDSGRLGRGKRYWTDEAVIDLVVGHLAVTAEVQGSRPVPYVVTLSTTEGRGVPSRRQVRIRCTCPDDEGFDSACKHAVAAMFALSDEVAIDPTVIDRWRGTAGGEGDHDTDPLGHDANPLDHGSDGVDRTGWASVTRLQPRAPRPWEAAAERHDEIQWGDEFPHDDQSDDQGDDLEWGSRLNRVVPLRRRPSDAGRDPFERSTEAADDDVDPFSAKVPGGRNSPRPVTIDPSVVQIAGMLQPPQGALPPTFPPAQPITHPRLADRLVDEVLNSALDEFDVNWL